jgi:hypothetical protein
MEKKTSKAVVKTENGPTRKVMLTADFGQVYIKVTKDGQIMRPVRAQMALFEKMGHYYKVKKKWGITKPGYKHLNKVASISIVTPLKVVVDGREQPNPFIERNPETKLIESVWIRKMGIGFSPMGNVVVVDKTLLYNIYSYFIESIQSKMKKAKWDSKNNCYSDEKLHPNCAVIGTAEDKPRPPEFQGKWAFYPTAPPLGLWINYEDSAIIDCLNEHTQKQRFGDRIAQTIVERNILKDHPAIGVDEVQPQATGGRAFVEVYGYRHDFGPSQINEILAQAEKGSETIEVEAEVTDNVTEEEEAEALKEVEGEVQEEAEKKEKRSPAEMKEPDDEFFLKQQKEKKEHKPGEKE